MTTKAPMRGRGGPRLGLWMGLLSMSAGLLPVLVVLLSNPLNRVYSHHGYIHTSIIYRIVHTGVPPTHPFLADHPLPYYWGYHFLAAGFVQLGMTPGWASAVINVLALTACLALVWWIAKQLVVDRIELPGTNRPSATWVALCAGFAALFAPAYLPPILVAQQFAGSMGFSFPDPRGMPIAIKFVNQSGMTLGVVFVVSWMASMIGMYQGRRVVVCALATGISLLGCAFFYPPMLPSLVLGTPAVALLFVLRSPSAQRRLQWKRGVTVCLSGASGVLITMPYLLQVAESLRGNTRILDPSTFRDSLIWVLVLMIPTVAYGWTHRQKLRGRLANIPLQVLLGIVGSSFVLYLLLNQPLRTEYKYLSVAMIAMGFLGGAIFALAWRRSSLFSWCIAGVFVVTPGYSFVQKLSYHTDYPTAFVESGSDLLYSGDSEREALFTWIRGQTSTDALFLDPIGTVPIYGQRGALMTPNERDLIGFGGNPYRFLAVHDQELIERRLLVLAGRADEAAMRREIPDGMPVYRIVDRQESWGLRVDPKLWRDVYRTPRKHYRVLLWIGNGASL
jgi:hypothetical protein